VAYRHRLNKFGRALGQASRVGKRIVWRVRVGQIACITQCSGNLRKLRDVASGQDTSRDTRRPCKAKAAADSPDSKRLCEGQHELEKNMWHSVHVSIHKPTHSPRQRPRFQTKESSGMQSNDSESAWLTLRHTPSIRGLRILADLVVHIFNELVVRRNLDQARQPSARSVSLNDKATRLPK
jgi:hypothetical protein